MPFTYEPYKPPPLTNLRERLVKDRLDRLSSYEASFERSLQAARERGLSPVMERLNVAELENIKALRTKLRDGLDAIGQQNAAERKAERRMRDTTPLERKNIRHGFYRSGKDRNTAIEGILERERRRTAPLTREAWSRAKAIAASRRLYSEQYSQLRGGRGYGYSPTPQDLAGFDPCLEVRKTRREVMFAKDLAGKGYRTVHKKQDC